MLKSLTIKNYKSIEKLDLELGRINIFIGENGCGKSNILEALALAAAAESKKLDNEFLSSRGIRVTEPLLMRCRFNDKTSSTPIEIKINFTDANIAHTYRLKNDNEPYSKWTSSLSRGVALSEILETLKNLEPQADEGELQDPENEKLNEIFKILLERHDLVISEDKNKFRNFIIYSPENTALRNFYKEGQIEPLGINGEGLLKLLKITSEKSPKLILRLKENMKLFSWYKNLEIPEDLSEKEDKIFIQDKYLSSATIDQKSANEGFLYLLFYITLVTSTDTPDFFAIDNIDASLNPKLCTKLMKTIVELAKEFNKQVILTTHNPAILDGIDLTDSEQKLFVISRGKHGQTKAKEITAESKPKSSTNEELKLSEAMLRGYLGGLPKGF